MPTGREATGLGHGSGVTPEGRSEVGDRESDCARADHPGVVACSLALLGRPTASTAASSSKVLRIDRVADGDTVDLTNGAKVRLFQIDTPEVYFHPDCYGRRASALTKRLLRPRTAVRLIREPGTDSVDGFGRLLRYVIRRRDSLNGNVRLVAVGAAAPYFYRRRRGSYAAELERLAVGARSRHLGLWGRCPGTPYDPYAGVSTGPPR